VTVKTARQAHVRPQRLVEMARRGAASHEGLGLYRLDPFPPHELDSYRKATLWPYPVEGILSHATALDLFELSDVNPAKIDITVPTRYRIRRRQVPPLYALHHEDLAGADVTRHEGLPIVTPATAIRQCHRAHLRRDLLRQALANARGRGLVTHAEYSELLHELELDSAVESPE
jgi:predicted transcriptional regulator of viral defense system